MRTRESGHDDPVTNMYMAGERRVVGHDRIAAYMAIVGDVYVRHDPVVVRNRGFVVALDRATTDCTEFADRISVADDQPGRLIGVLLIMWVVADRGELIYMVVFAYYRRAINDYMTVDTRTTANFDVVADN